MPDHNNGGQFTVEDRTQLTTVGVEVRNLKDDMREVKAAILESRKDQRTLVDHLSSEVREAVSENHKEHLNLIAALRQEVGVLEGRVRVVENFRWWVLGAAAGIGFITGGLASKILH